jgi:hypothetical protein
MHIEYHLGARTELEESLLALDIISSEVIINILALRIQRMTSSGRAFLENEVFRKAE